MRKQGAREIGRSGRGGRGRGKWTVSTLHLPVHVEVGGLLVLAAGAPNVTCLPRLNVPLQAGGLHVSEQELDTDMEHAKIHVWAAVAARACASMQRARYLWLAPSTDSDSCSHLFCLRRLKRHQGTDFSSICRKEFDYTEKRRVCTHHFTLYLRFED